MEEGEKENRAPRRVHLESLARQGDEESKAILENTPPLPPLAAHLWAYWADLSATRPSGGMGPSRLSRLEIRQWELDEGVRLERWERRLIIEVDGLWARIMSGFDPYETNDEEPQEEVSDE